jgi:hypothetical protein
MSASSFVEKIHRSAGLVLSTLSSQRSHDITILELFLRALRTFSFTQCLTHNIPIIQGSALGVPTEISAAAVLITYWDDKVRSHRRYCKEANLSG